jgi:hypothetical protein
MEDTGVRAGLFLEFARVFMLHTDGILGTYLGRINLLLAVGVIQGVSLRNLPARSRYRS